MKKFVVLALALGALTVLAPQAQAWGRSWGCCAPSCCPPQVCYRVECVPVKCVVQVPRCVPVKREIQVCVPHCRMVPREVCTVRYVPQDCVDCCGCHYCCYRPEVCRTVVQCPVWESHFEPRTIICNTIVFEPCTVIRHVYRCVPVPCCE
jgi:hypothetical protein